MSIDLTKTPTIFIVLMDRVFKEYLDMFVIVFISDILMCLKSEENHASHLKIVLQTI